MNLSSLEASLQAAKRKAEEIRLGYTDIHEEGRELAKKRQEIEAGKAALKEEEQSLEIRNREQEQEITALEAKTGEARETLEKRREALSAVQLEFSAMSQKDSFLLENIRRINGELEALIREEEELTEALSGGRTAVTEKQQEIQSIREQIAGLTAQAGTYQKQIEADTEKKAACTKEQGSFFAKQEDMNAELGRLDKEQFRLENQKEKCEEAMEAQIQYLWEEYELTPSQVEAPDPAGGQDASQIRKETLSLKQAIRELGPVNVNAVEDYKEISERYFFMKGQYDDLKTAEESLLEVIEELDCGMRRQFEEKFRDIRREFDHVFKEMFGGGQGTLELVEGEDLLEAGIQIIAQPPGKKLQNMMQLSGGEKALTAISLLFAIQNLKPSPFCLLDEIEAALDDSNVGRYAAYLGKLKKHTQFIVITHRRGTMLVADRLYGITMQEKGVSTLVSVDLTEQTA